MQPSTENAPKHSPIAWKKPILPEQVLVEFLDYYDLEWPWLPEPASFLCNDKQTC